MREKLFTYLLHLALKLPRRKSGPGYQFDEEVELDYYRLRKISEGSICRPGVPGWARGRASNRPPSRRGLQRAADAVFPSEDA